MYAYCIRIKKTPICEWKRSNIYLFIALRSLEMAYPLLPFENRYIKGHGFFKT